MKTLQKGFTLIELMIVVAIIGILAAVAIPAYQDYIARAQVSEAVNLLASGKTGMAEYFADKATWPPAATDVMGSTAGKYTNGIVILASATTGGGTLTLEATMKPTGINASITSGSVMLYTGDGGKIWTCAPGTTAPTLASKYLPSACR
jgi:type IV pilus assembly protein PilA